MEKLNRTPSLSSFDELYIYVPCYKTETPGEPAVHPTTTIDASLQQTLVEAGTQRPVSATRGRASSLLWINNALRYLDI
jgi:hypothetical protein